MVVVMMVTTVLKLRVAVFIRNNIFFCGGDTTTTTPISTSTQCTLNHSTPTYIPTATIMAVVRVSNVNVVGVVYLSICLVVGMVVVVVLVEMWRGRSGCCWVFFGMVAQWWW